MNPSRLLAGDTKPAVQIHLARLLFRTSLATSVSDGSRKLKPNAGWHTQTRFWLLRISQSANTLLTIL
jgi:hypothetical protein